MAVTIGLRGQEIMNGQVPILVWYLNDCWLGIIGSNLIKLLSEVLAHRYNRYFIYQYLFLGIQFENPMTAAIIVSSNIKQINGSFHISVVWTSYMPLNVLSTFGSGHM